jgi:1-aminocyclopropane-1-carboxylate deaminase/D-cysteine desulfhydrase-like pyridoxal-dependent ACC family enzyme
MLAPSCLDQRIVLPAPLYPTPVRACPELSHARAELWLKNDGCCHAIYGGNKVRKAERLIAEAERRGAQRVLSFGAAGSHHLLTLTMFARAAGLQSAALVLPQPRTTHASNTLRAAIGLGLQVYPVQHVAWMPWLLPRVLRPSDYLIAPGGSNAIGARACADAIDELAQQIAMGDLPSPDWIVVPLGSGGTCAGFAAGVVRRGLPCRVLGVQVVGGVGPRLAARYLARKVLQRSGGREKHALLATQLSFDESQIGPGYGASSPAGARATNIARKIGLELDQTYTAKAFAAVLQLLDTASDSDAKRLGRPQRILYWHTLSATSLEPLLREAPSESELPEAVRSLLR